MRQSGDMGGEALRAALAAVTAPAAQARGLPSTLYTDERLLAAERQALFDSTWACLGFEADVPAPGDVCPVDLQGRPLLLLRDGDGAIRVFENVCRHRGMRLVTVSGRVRTTLRCPYHSWCYDLTGALRSTPHAGGPGKAECATLERESLGLLAVRSACWMGLVFVNLDGTAPAFEAHVAPLAARWRPFMQQPLFADPAETGFELEVGCNWKLAVENYCESYHLPWIHPGLNRYSRLEDHYNILEPGRFAGQGTRVYAPTLDESGGRFPAFAGLPESWRTLGEYVALFPNVLLGAHRDHAFAMLLLPQGMARTRERTLIWYADSAALGPDFAGLRERHRALWREVFDEDVAAVEGLQAGRAAPGFDGGRFAPAMDEATHGFHAWAASRLLAQGENETAGGGRAAPAERSSIVAG